MPLCYHACLEYKLNHTAAAMSARSRADAYFPGSSSKRRMRVLKGLRRVGISVAVGAWCVR